MALLGMAVVGVALIIVGLSMVVSGLTMEARYLDPPPNLGQLGIGALLGGIGLTLLGVTHIILAGAVLADVRHARSVAVAANAFTATLAGVGVALVMGQGPAPDRVLAIGLAVMALLFGAAALALFRRR